jgi:hypothetical protein
MRKGLALFTLGTAATLLLFQSGFIHRPTVKADTLPLTSFEARWQFNANALENMSKSMPDDLAHALNERAFSKRN